MCRVCLAQGLSVKKDLRAAKALTKHTLGPIYLPRAGLSQKMQFDNIKTEKDARTFKEDKVLQQRIFSLGGRLKKR